MHAGLIVSLFCLFIQLKCFYNLKDENIRIKHEKTSLNGISILEINSLKECAIKMDTCIKKCNELYPYSYFENSNREKCKDRCIDQTINSDGCYMYYRSSRGYEFRAYTTR